MGLTGFFEQQQALEILPCCFRVIVVAVVVVAFFYDQEHNWAVVHRVLPYLYFYPRPRKNGSNRQTNHAIGHYRVLIFVTIDLTLVA